MQPICDLHLDTVLELRGGRDLGAGNPEGHADVARMRAGGAGLLVFACFVPWTMPHGRVFAEANRLLDEIDRSCDQLPADLLKVTTAAEAESAVAAGRVAILPAIENGHAIECDLAKLEALRARGVRYMTLTHARHLTWAKSSGEEWSGDEGLHPFGREVVRAMEDLGIVVDVSHVHPTTLRDASRIARKPFIASHSCAHALCPIARNLADDEIRRIADSGGMIGINFFPAFLDPTYMDIGKAGPRALFDDIERIERQFADDPAGRTAAMHQAARKSRERLGPPSAGADTVVAHIRHVVDLVGDDHVGIGSDYDGVPEVPRDLPDVAAYPHLLERLRAAGFGEASVRKIAWENFLRVLRACGG
jgi:membrane dipeptidase